MCHQSVTLLSCLLIICNPLMNCLFTQVLGHMQNIGSLINTLWNGLELEDILETLNTMYRIISNTGQLLDWSVLLYIPSHNPLWSHQLYGLHLPHIHHWECHCSHCISYLFQDGGTEVCPAMAHLLSLVPTAVVEVLAPRILSYPPGPSDSALTATLTRLTAWLVVWPTAQPTLELWVRTLARLLYHRGRTIVPARVTLDRVPKVKKITFIYFFNEL